MATQADIEVRLEDQEKINEFGKLNNRLLEIRADIKQMKADIEKLDDATAELMMNTGGTVKLFMGESFIETDEDYATEFFIVIQQLQDEVATLTREETAIVQRQELLKKELYGRFGDSINLEN
eukprot:gene42504-51924_t